MVHGQEDLGIAGGDALAGGHHVAGQISVGEHDALALAGGAGGVDDAGQGIRRHGGLGKGAVSVLHEIFPFGHIGIKLIDREIEHMGEIIQAVEIIRHIGIFL